MRCTAGGARASRRQAAIPVLCYCVESSYFFSSPRFSEPDDSLRVHHAPAAAGIRRGAARLPRQAHEQLCFFGMHTARAPEGRKPVVGTMDIRHRTIVCFFLTWNRNSTAKKRRKAAQYTFYHASGSERRCPNVLCNNDGGGGHRAADSSTSGGAIHHRRATTAFFRTTPTSGAGGAGAGCIAETAGQHGRRSGAEETPAGCRPKDDGLDPDDIVRATSRCSCWRVSSEEAPGAVTTAEARLPSERS